MDATFSGNDQDDAPLPTYLCIVEVQSRPGAVFGVDSSVKARPLTWPKVLLVPT